MHKILKEDGVFIIETLNFDKIINQNVELLEAIIKEKEKISLTTELEREGEYINCISKLLIEGKEFLNEELLVPILSDDIVEFLSVIGFRKIKAYGDYDGSKFDKEESNKLIITCEK